MLIKYTGNVWLHLVFQLHPVGNSLELCRETPGISLDHLPEFLLGILLIPVALLGETRPLGFSLLRDFSSRPDSSHLLAQVCVCVSHF